MKRLGKVPKPAATKPPVLYLAPHSGLTLQPQRWQTTTDQRALATPADIIRKVRPNSPESAQTPDEAIYRFAGGNGFTIVTNDDEFEFLSQQIGVPPKVVLSKIGNSTVTMLREFPDRHRHQIAGFIQAADEHRLLKIGPAEWTHHTAAAAFATSTRVSEKVGALP